MTNDLSPSVQMQFMRPAQLEAAARAFAVVYVPFGLIEWHGRHLPLGNDALKAHGILVKCAEKYGGVVYPPVFFPHAIHNPETGELVESDRGWKLSMVTALFDGLKQTGFRVIIGVSGHNIQTQIDLINEALKPVVADGTITGIGLWEMSLSRCEESDSDHAAKWETSNMMFFYPDFVDMSELGTEPLAPDMQPPHGIGGLDPREHASVEVGRRNVELASEAIGKKAQELLKSLPEDKQSFSLEAISPEHWWSV
ncbi:MAG: creatininase family protein [Planctomycetes bacterium]|nr:creatininase family protein [Planctomycetota bacterium]